MISLRGHCDIFTSLQSVYVCGRLLNAASKEGLIKSYFMARQVASQVQVLCHCAILNCRYWLYSDQMSNHLTSLTLLFHLLGHLCLNGDLRLLSHLSFFTPIVKSSFSPRLTALTHLLSDPCIFYSQIRNLNNHPRNFFYSKHASKGVLSQFQNPYNVRRTGAPNWRRIGYPTSPPPNFHQKASCEKLFRSFCSLYQVLSAQSVINCLTWNPI